MRSDGAWVGAYVMVDHSQIDDGGVGGVRRLYKVVHEGGRRKPRRRKLSTITESEEEEGD